MTEPHVEYVGFTSDEVDRRYVLRVKQLSGEAREFTLVIPNQAFLAHLVRYQDAPEICFLKLQRELAAHADGMPESRLYVTDADLEDYRTSHAPRPPQRRARPPVQPQ
jgi:hypothetical protein